MKTAKLAQEIRVGDTVVGKGPVTSIEVFQNPEPNHGDFFGLKFAVKLDEWEIYEEDQLVEIR